jgi:DNA-directed RNA polymerase subunit M/transcription elongation factor TFIIS
MSSLEQTDCPECAQIIHYQPQRWKTEVVCSNCQATFTVEAAQPPALPTDENIPIPSHLQGQTDVEESPSSETVPSSSPEPRRYSRSKFASVLNSGLIVIVLLLLLGGGIVALIMWDTNTEKKNKEQRQANGNSEEITYVLAGKKRVKLAGFEIGVKFVEYGPIRVKDQQAVVHESSGSLLQIYLEMRSRRNNPMTYVSWYGNSFDREGVQQVATLTDENGNPCEMPVFDDVTGVFGHTAEAILERNGRLEDCLIFELPAGVKITDFKELRLTLPMENIGNSGNIYFKILEEDIRLVGGDPQ